MIAVILVAVLFYYCGRIVYKQLIRKPDLAKYQKGDSWAVVTGASDGIGMGFVRVLASYGFNVLLVSKSEDKLQLRSQSFIF